MQLSLESIADAIEGEITGSGNPLLTGISFLDTATPDELAFAMNKGDFDDLELRGRCKAGAVIVPDYYEGNRANVIRVSDIKLAVAKAIALFMSDPKHPSLQSRTLKSKPGSWYARIDRSYRFIYTYSKDDDGETVCTFIDVGPHAVID